jgi:hypothetical protein
LGDTGRTYRFACEYALDGSWGEAGRSPSMLAGAGDTAPRVAEPPTGTVDRPVPLSRLVPKVEPRLMIWGFQDMGHFDLPRGIAFNPLDDRSRYELGRSSDILLAKYARFSKSLSRHEPCGKEVDGILALAYDVRGGWSDTWRRTSTFSTGAAAPWRDSTFRPAGRTR